MISDSLKHKADVVAVSGAFAGFFKLIPWSEIAAFAACIYTVLRICELVWGWIKKKREA